MAVSMVADDEFASAYLRDGRVKIPGVDAIPERSGLLYLSALNDPPYDVMVVPIANLVVAMDLGRPLTGIPVFPDMFFPHTGPRVNKNAGIREPKDLEGKRVSTRGFGFNPSVWMRGALIHQYDVSVEKITWVEEEPNSMSGVEFQRSRRFRIEKGGSAADDLESGRVDAAFFGRGGPEPTENTEHLFVDPLAEALAYRELTGIFPPNTVQVISERALADNPGIGQAIVDGNDEAWDLYCKEAADSDDHMGLPVKFLRDNGMFPHRNGLESNYSGVEMVSRYLFELGLTKRAWRPEELFFAGAK
ncbi:MAG: hypothetical protein IIB37_12720 [Gemmatimonadetes bacterium]|nr:hypothetical protein [Gemmatimonadota bacterium]